MENLASASDLHQRCVSLCKELGLAAGPDVQAVEPLTGGVAADIARVDIDGKSYCVKFALLKLRVKADWQVPVHRNRAEYEWLRFAHSVAPDSAPRLFGCSEAMHGFVMEYLSGEDTYLWKQAMLSSRSKGEEAGRVAGMLGRIHAASTRPGFDRSPFENREDFFAIRLEPYLTFTAARHGEIANRLNDLAERFRTADIALVHGDVSPKNILIRAGNPVLLDAECATMGDPAFDVAFCLNHLVIKALHLPGSRESLLAAVQTFWNNYAPQITWEKPDALEPRVAELLPALMLGRVDGKSPVEYLGERERDALRRLAIPIIAEPPAGLSEIVSYLGKEMKD